jgi:hypothetical protein
VEYMLGAFVVLLAVAAVVHPLVWPRARADQSDSIGSVLEGSPEARRAAIYREIADMQFDHRLGKLDDSDYLELREQLLAHAAELLAEDDHRRLLIDQFVECQIAEIRATAASREPVGSKAVDGP